MGSENQIVAYLADDGFCRLLEQLMKQQNVAVKKLSEGLCCVSMLSRIKQGQRVPDKMMRDRLLERLGISDERNENLLDYEDYVKWEARRNIVKCVKRKEISKARKLLTEYAGNKDFVGKIEQQFYHAMEIQLMLYENTAAEHLAKRLEMAVKLTVPNIDDKKIFDLQLSLQELNLVLEYEKYGHPERFKERCRELLQYIEHSAMDERNRAKIYPKVTCYLCEALSRDGEMDYAEILLFMNRAIECCSVN